MSGNGFLDLFCVYFGEVAATNENFKYKEEHYVIVNVVADECDLGADKLNKHINELFLVIEFVRIQLVTEKLNIWRALNK